MLIYKRYFKIYKYIDDIEIISRYLKEKYSINLVINNVIKKRI